MTTVKEDIIELKTELKHLTHGIDDIKKTLQEHVKWEDGKYSEMNKSFAGKWVEKLTISAVITALGAIIAIAIQST